MLGSMTQAKREEEDDFLKGFYSVADRPKEETSVTTKLQTDYKPGDWIRSTMTKPNPWNAKNTDLSPQKVNYASQDTVDSQEENSDLKEFGAESETYKILQDLGQRWKNASEDERERLHTVAEEVRRLARGGNRVKYAHDEIMELLHHNVDEASDYQKWMNEGVSGFLYDMGNNNSLLDSSLFLIGMTNYGPWDYKRQEEWRVEGNTQSDGKEYYDGKDLDAHNYRNWLEWMYFDGHLIGADKLGNMNMSYVGKKMGLPEWVYKNFTTMDKDDAEWVQYGIDLANSGR